MSELELLAEDNVINDLENIFEFNNLPDGFFDFEFESEDAVPASDPVDAPSPQKTPRIGEIENFLMEDDGDDYPREGDDKALLDNFLSGILLVPDYPAAESESHHPSPPPASASDDNSSHSKDISTANITISPDQNENGNITATAGDDDDDTHLDPISKKLRRQLRNRDAASRSRERKKLYVRDLEIKSRYLEAECRRLGRLLECCYAENQMLRLSLHGGSAFGAPFAKQESAVLLLESLLLGSLLWFLGIMCLLPLPGLLQFTRDAALLGNVNNRGQESVAPRGTRSKVVELWGPVSFLRSKRCRASRTKMKYYLPSPGFCMKLL
ncbi:hypothetical protein Ancab_007113 [Ancistrocladus abbreviatus]